jgi:hypothetical protein
MKKLYSLALLLCLVFAFSKPVVADHIIGSDITYTCTSTPGIYLVTFVYYRDCSGIPVCTQTCGAACSRTMQIKGADPSCSSSTFGSFTLNLVSVRDYDPKLSCPLSKNICDNMGCSTPGTFSPGIERYEFQGSVNIGPTSGIPASCCNVRFVFDECCRSAQISTGSTWENFYVDAVVNRCLSLSPCNSSPQFTTEPYDIVCGGQPVLYNNGTIEPDRDSLSYEFTPALQGFGSSVTYTPPFAFDKPMPWSGTPTAAFPNGIRCDAKTGDIMFSPGNSTGSNFYGIIAILVKQWKTISGVPTVIGTTRRDIQMVIGANCAPNNAPILTTIPADTGVSGLNPKLNWEVCESSQLCFDLVSRDRDTNFTALISDTTYLQWDQSLASMGATFTPNYVNSTRKLNGPREDSYQFCWTPPVGSAAAAPYIVVFKNYDSKCPIPGRNARGFSIKVNPMPTGSIVKTPQACGAYTLSYVNDRPQFPTSVKWKIAKLPYDYTFSAGADSFAVANTPIINFWTPGKYLVQLNLFNNNCINTLYDTLVVDTLLKATAINDTLVCASSVITLNVKANHGVPPYTYRWFNSIKDTLLSPMNAPNFTLSTAIGIPSVTRTFTVQVRDASGCRAYDSVLVTVNKGVKKTELVNLQCHGLNSGQIVLNMLDTLMPYQYRINNGSFQSSNSFTGLSSGVYTVETKDTNNCRITLYDLNITQPEYLRDTITSAKHETCNGYDNGELITYAVGGLSPYRYSIDSLNFKRTGEFFNLTPGTYKIHILDTNNCYLGVSKTVAAADSLYHFTSITNVSCFGQNNGEIRTQGKGGTPPYTYKFGFTGGFTSDSVHENKTASTYPISIKDKNECVINFSKTITQPTKIFNTRTIMDASCFGSTNGSATLRTIGGIKPYQYRNGINGTSQSDSVFNNLAAGNYTLYTIDSIACFDSVKITINQPLQTTATLSKQNPSCYQKADGRITATVTQGKAPFVYALNNGVFGTSNSFQNLAGDTFTITIKDSSGCLINLPTTLTTPPQIIAGSISGNTTVLQNAFETYSISPQPGLTYFWNIQKGSLLSGQTTSSVSVKWDSIGVGAIGVAVYSDSTCGDTATLTVNIGVNSIAESAKQLGLEVYPNPTSGQLNITLQKLPTEHTLKLYDMQGKLIIEQELKRSQQLNIEALPQGVYLLKIGEWRGQVIKK